MAHTRDVLKLAENKQGCDYVIADLHGNVACLQLALQRLGAHDRLFIAGDLIDRGRMSADLLEIIFSHQQSNPEQVYLVKGNHEVLCLESIPALQKLKETIKNLACDDGYANEISKWCEEFSSKTWDDTDFNNLKLHIQSGGKWFVTLFRQELDNDRLSYADENELVSCSESLIAKLEIYINQLPIIIYVEGNKPFFVVHADMPLSDRDILDAIDINPSFKLTPEQVNHALNTRFNIHHKVAITAHRSILSIQCYVGHNITAFGRAAVIRADTNTTNLDSGAFKTKVLLMVNHTDGTCFYVGEKITESLNKYPLLKNNLAELSEYLEHRHKNHEDETVVNNHNKREIELESGAVKSKLSIFQNDTQKKLKQELGKSNYSPRI